MTSSKWRVEERRIRLLSLAACRSLLENPRGPQRLEVGRRAAGQAGGSADVQG